MKPDARKKPGLVRSVGKGAAKGLSRLGKDTATGVIGELLSIATLGLFRPRKRKY